MMLINTNRFSNLSVIMSVGVWNEATWILLWQGLMLTLQISTIAGFTLVALATMQVATDIRGGRTPKSEPCSVWLAAWKWVDVGVREIPWVGWSYSQVYESLDACWWFYLSRQHFVVPSVQLVPLPNPDDGAYARVFQNLNDAWRQESRLMTRTTAMQERAWTFVPSTDYVILYTVKDSWLPHEFFAFYPKGQLAIFPPCPLSTYWKPPAQSRIAATLWSHPSGALTPTDPALTHIVQCSAGPLQTLKLYTPTHTTTTTPDDNIIGSSMVDSHEWNWKMWKTYFPQHFTTPSVVSIKPTKTSPTETSSTTELSASEKRRLARLKQATSSADASSTISLIVTRCNQTTTVISSL
jgi:hypothetical protein